MATKTEDRSVVALCAEALYHQAVLKYYQAREHTKEYREFYGGLTVGGLGVGTLAALGEVL